MKTLQEQIDEKKDEYIKLLGEELDEVVVLAHIHGWKSKRYEQGKKLRDELSTLKDQLKEQDKYCTCGNPSGEGNVHFEEDEKLIYECIDCGKIKKDKEQEVSDELIDLQQYVTNLLYYAHVEAMDMHSVDFDKWVEREVENLKGYYARQNQLPTDEEIEAEMGRKGIVSAWDRVQCRTMARWMRDGLIKKGE